MAITLICLRLTLGLFELNSAPALNVCGAHLKERAGCTEVKAVAGVNTESVKCKLQGTAHLPAFSMEGNYVIGGVFSIHEYLPAVRHNYTTKPEPFRLRLIESRELRFSRVMVFAIEEINNSTKLLPGIRLGYQIHDSCAAVPVAVHVAFQLSNGLDPVFYTSNNCSKSGMVMAVVGESGSTPSISISHIIGSFNIPLVSHFATCACLSDKRQYPSFFRTIPSDRFQAAALAKLVKHFGWTWIGAPTKGAASPVLTEFWEDAFNCRLEKDRRVCDGSEDIQKLQNPYTDTSQLRISNMVYKAVYAIAHAIHNTVCQETNSTTQCDKLTRIEPKQVLTQLKKVNFSQNGYHVSFDSSGDPVATYELVNWQKSERGSIVLVTVGYYDAPLPLGEDSSWHLMAINSEDLKKRIVALHKDGLGYKKIAKTLKLSCNTVAKTIQRFNRTGSTQNRPRHGRPKKLSACAQHHIQRLALGNRRMSAANIAAKVEGVGGSAC
uniref:extracellular calcium-sensing receptor-like n=1 Tax=Monopterus albus TaxID=43700 RepID=UPI0009B3701E|nr:extracellular calcium-sensing receptor-like [Monopterus albus]